MERQCTICNISKDITLFTVDKRRSQGRTNQCGDCIKIKNKEYRKTYKPPPPKTYKRTCELCNETQILSGMPRAKFCMNCSLSHIGRRTGTGRINTSNCGGGYHQIKVGSKVMYSHRYIMEKYLGRKLLRNEHVHHINHNKLDNRIENLELISPTNHAKEHLTKDLSDRINLIRKLKRMERNASVSV